MKLVQISEIPNSEFANDLDNAVKDYSKTCGIKKYGINPEGFYKQITEAIVNRLIHKLQPNAQTWVATDNDNKLAGFMLTHFSLEIDNKLTMTMSDGWVRKDLRNTVYPKDWIDKIREYAILSGVKHILFPCGRHYKAWNKYLDNRMTKYITYLKEDFN